MRALIRFSKNRNAAGASRAFFFERGNAILQVAYVCLRRQQKSFDAVKPPPELPLFAFDVEKARIRFIKAGAQFVKTRVCFGSHLADFAADG